MKRNGLFLFMIIFGCLSLAGEVVPLPELEKPTLVMVEQNQAVIADFPHVYIYSLGDYKLVAKIGQKGEGPKEFSGGLRLQPDPNYIIIGSRMKVSYYTRDGKFVKEVRSRSSSVASVYKPLGEKYAAYGRVRDKDTRYNTVNIYDADLTKIKEVIRWEHPIQPGKQVDPTDSDLQGGEFRTFDKKIFVLLRKMGNVEVFDDNGDKLFSINHEYDRVKFGSEDRARFDQFYKTDPRYRAFYEQALPFMKYPSYFPCAREFFVTDGKIYILTNKRAGEKSRFVIYDVNGKYIKNVMVPFFNLNPREFFPFYVKDGRLYQLADNEETEEWELHIHDLK